VSRRSVVAVIGVLLAVSACGESRPDLPVVRVGSKSFTESYIVAEIVAQIIDETGEARAERRLGLGGTGILYTALAAGDIDVYPEYTGTISRAILKDAAAESVPALRERLRTHGLTISEPL
jgi:osmoprotectant transport system permease protein